MLQPKNTLLFIGDSITHAHRRPDEFHDVYYLGHGYVSRLAGELNTDLPHLAFKFINRGECGNTVASLKQRWEQDCLAHQPALISILIGINDAHANQRDQDIVQFEDTYRQLLRDAKKALPGVKLVLLEPFGVRLEPGHSPPVSVISANQNEAVRLRQPIVRTLAAEFSAVFVPLQDAFDVRGINGSHWSLDGIHPSSAGHCIIARRWLKAVKEAGWLPKSH